MVCVNLSIYCETSEAGFTLIETNLENDILERKIVTRLHFKRNPLLLANIINYKGSFWAIFNHI